MKAEPAPTTTKSSPVRLQTPLRLLSSVVCASEEGPGRLGMVVGFRRPNVEVARERREEERADLRVACVPCAVSDQFRERPGAAPECAVGRAPVHHNPVLVVAGARLKVSGEPVAHVGRH